MSNDRKHRPWISSTYLGKTIRFPNSTAWRLTDVLAEKAMTPMKEDGPPEASAVFACTQVDGPQSVQAVIRVRMQ